MLYVALGRNVGDKPMELYKWEEFQKRVVNAIYTETFVDPDTVAYGNSRYGSMREETCVMVWFDVNAKLCALTLAYLKLIAQEFGQEAIAWSVSVTEFVEGVA
jgi:hypothetical protein